MTGIAERRNEGTGPIDGGFIILSRTIEAEGGTFKYCRSNDERWMFIKSLLRANFQDVVVNGIELKRGQFLTSIEKFAKETKTTPKRVRRFWNFFEKLGFQVSKRTNKYTIITILNYDRYQNMANYFGGKGHAEGQTKGKQRATDKEYKEGKGKKEGVLTLIRTIIEEYKRVKGYDEQPDWDKNYLERYVRSAKDLYRIAGEEWKEAMEWMSEQPYAWTLETVIAKYPDFKIFKATPQTMKP